MVYLYYKCMLAGHYATKNKRSRLNIVKVNPLPLTRFLKALAVFDLLVVVCCMWMYSLPALSADFHEVSECTNVCSSLLTRLIYKIWQSKNRL
jgi:hypothetical protein